MTYLSEWVGKGVIDSRGNPAGILKDLVVSGAFELEEPNVVAVVLQQAQQEVIVSAFDLREERASFISLGCALENAQRYETRSSDLSILHDILDQEAILTVGARVARINDLIMGWKGNGLVLSQVITGLKGILLRLGWGQPCQALFDRLQIHLPEGAVPWEQVIVLNHRQFPQVAHRLAALHPADLAKILCDLSPVKSIQLLEALRCSQIARVLEPMRLDTQALFFDALPEECRLPVLESMAPEKAAYLLSTFSSQARERLIQTMDGRAAREIQKVIVYPRNTAGSLMSSQFASLPPELTAGQAMAALHQLSRQRHLAQSIYVIDRSKRILGVLSLSDLVAADPEVLLSALMNEPAVSARALDPLSRVVQKLMRYPLPAIPVVDDQDRLVGVIPLENIVDRLIPARWKPRVAFPH